VFVNTRKLAERVAHHLQERLGADAVLPHHGSLSRKLRLEAEQRLKSGELRAVVATASLELGIDIGTVDLVCQVESPRSIAVGLQRVGRSGHWVGALPKGRFFPTTRDNLIECAALVRAIRAGEWIASRFRRRRSIFWRSRWSPRSRAANTAKTKCSKLVRGTWPYRELARRDFDAVVEMLSEGIATARGRRGAFLHRDGVNHRLRGRRGARLSAITNGGAIPDSSLYQVIAEPEGSVVGTLDEISQSRATSATFSCWGPRRGRFVAWSPDAFE
jgi:ATP-dependent Lhr-like helicase